MRLQQRGKDDPMENIQAAVKWQNSNTHVRLNNHAIVSIWNTHPLLLLLLLHLLLLRRIWIIINISWIIVDGNVIKFGQRRLLHALVSKRMIMLQTIIFCIHYKIATNHRRSCFCFVFANDGRTLQRTRQDGWNNNVGFISNLFGIIQMIWNLWSNGGTECPNGHTMGQVAIVHGP